MAEWKHISEEFVAEFMLYFPALAGPRRVSVAHASFANRSAMCVKLLIAVVSENAMDSSTSSQI